MSIALDAVVPWGRGLREYERMFALTDADLRLPILDCAAGPASFNAEASARGTRVVSCDPVYRHSSAAIASRIDATYPRIVADLEANRDAYVWDEMESPGAVAQARMAAMTRFLTDYGRVGRRADRYVASELPHLPFENDAFALALCSHFPFLYAPGLPLSFHVDALLELCRVAAEVRVFPLVDASGVVSSFLDPARAALHEAGHATECVRVPYEFQRGGHTMLRVRTVPPTSPSEIGAAVAK
jgi:hypothetical protein